MGAVFHILGWLLILGGAAWAALVLQLASVFTSTPAENLTTMLALAPALGTMFFGLLLVALGGVFHRLDKIVRYTAISARALKPLADKTRVTPGQKWWQAGRAAPADEDSAGPVGPARSRAPVPHI